jgi:hypothetical protein
MTAFLLTIHGLLAVALLGAVTHQIIVLWRTEPATGGDFLARLKAVRAGSYTNAVVVLYALDFFIGAIIYATYRLEVRPYLEDIGAFVAAGSFETKEHLAALGLGLLPAYWLVWKAPALAEAVNARRAVTVLLGFFVWWNFLVGHILNNLRGLPE